MQAVTVAMREQVASHNHLGSCVLASDVAHALVTLFGRKFVGHGEVSRIAGFTDGKSAANIRIIFLIQKESTRKKDYRKSVALKISLRDKIT
jgi:hypothetical protein